MMNQTKITNRVSPRSARPLRAGTWTLSLACGLLVAACSGTIDTPDEEFPPRRPSSEDSTPAPAAPARSTTPAPAPASNSTASAPPPSAAASNDDDDAEEDDDAAPVAPAEPEAPAASGNLNFEADVWPIFNSKCAGCHVTAGLGGQNVGSEDLAEALADAKRIEDKLLDDLGTGRMPPGCGAPPGGGGGCVSEDDFAAIEAWYEAGAPE